MYSDPQLQRILGGGFTSKPFWFKKWINRRPQQLEIILFTFVTQKKEVARKTADEVHEAERKWAWRVAKGAAKDMIGEITRTTAKAASRAFTRAAVRAVFKEFTKDAALKPICAVA